MINKSDDKEIFWEPTSQEEFDALVKKHNSIGHEKKSKKAKKNDNFQNKGYSVDPSLPQASFKLTDLKKFNPMTKRQAEWAKEYRENPDLHFLVIGSAGTGKTYEAISLAMEEILSGNSGADHLIIIRSTGEGRESGGKVGFLPGTLEEKCAVYEEPYYSICSEIFKKSHAYDDLKDGGYIDFMPTSFLRGTTFNNAIVLVDEIQNLTYSEINTVLTRIGKHSRIMLCGDLRQNDLNKSKFETSGLDDAITIIKRMTSYFGIHEFGHDDIVRSELVKAWIIESEGLGY